MCGSIALLRHRSASQRFGTRIGVPQNLVAYGTMFPCPNHRVEKIINDDDSDYNHSSTETGFEKDEIKFHESLKLKKNRY